VEKYTLDLMYSSKGEAVYIRDSRQSITNCKQVLNLSKKAYDIVRGVMKLFIMTRHQYSAEYFGFWKLSTDQEQQLIFDTWWNEMKVVTKNTINWNGQNTAKAWQFYKRCTFSRKRQIGE
jgi:hypothetical protein